MPCASGKHITWFEYAAVAAAGHRAKRYVPLVGPPTLADHRLGSQNQVCHGVQDRDQQSSAIDTASTHIVDASMYGNAICYAGHGKGRKCTLYL